MGKKAKAKKATKAKKAPAPEWLTPNGYAAHRKITRQAVQKALRTGRLEGCAEKDARGHWHIEKHAADAAWEAASDPTQKRARKAGGAPRRDPTPPLPGVDDEERAGERPHAPSTGGGEELTHARASARYTGAKAELAELELRRKLGELVPAAEVRGTLFRLGRKLRDRLQGIPNRIAAELAAESEPRKVHLALSAAIAQALEDLDRAERAEGGT